MPGEFLLPFLSLMVLSIGFIYDIQYFTIFIKVIVVHFLIEFIIYNIGIYKLSKPLRLFDFCIWFILHMPYVITMGIGSFLSNKLGWRGR